MGLFLVNTGLESLRSGNALDTKAVGELNALSTECKVGGPESGASYRTYRFASGLELVFKASGHVLVDVDMAYEGRCIWQGKPMAKLDSRGYLSLDLVMMGKEGKDGYVASIVRPASVPPFDSTQLLDLQVSAFPIGMDVFDTRGAYETATDEKVRLKDGQILAYNYVMARQQGLSKKEEAFFKRKEQFNLFAGEVVAVAKKDNEWRGSSFHVATVRTSQGNIDVLYGDKQVKRPLEAGCYLLCEALVSASIIAIDGKAC